MEKWRKGNVGKIKKSELKVKSWKVKMKKWKISGNGRTSESLKNGKIQKFL